MRFFYLKPEVAGGFGEGTALDHSVQPPLVSHLHHEFEGWLGDELLTTYPCFIVTRRVGERLEDVGATGFEFDTVEVSKSITFLELHPELELPEFMWLKIVGRPGVDDFGMDKADLVASERALRCLTEFKLEECRVKEYPHGKSLILTPGGDAVELDADVVRKLREMAKAGVSVCEMIVFLGDRAGGRVGRVYAGWYLREAFGLEIMDLANVGSWSYFPASTWTREQVEARVMPAIERRRHIWGSKE